MDEGGFILKNNLKRYVDDFFANLEMHEDYKNNHIYKDILKASIDVFLDIETAYTAFSVYEMFFSIYQIPTVNRSESGGNATAVNEPNIILDLIRIFVSCGKVMCFPLYREKPPQTPSQD